MALIRALSVFVLFSAGISLSSAYNVVGPHEKHDGICGGHCRGNTGIAGPCFFLSGNEEKACEWANDHCCPPNGNGNQWTTTTTTTTTTRRPLSSSKDDKKDDFESKFITLWVIGAILSVALYVGVPICIFCCIMSQQRKRRVMNPGPSVYPGTGAGAYQPVYQPQPHTPAAVDSPSFV